jgi:hypothetical protein
MVSAGVGARVITTGASVGGTTGATGTSVGGTTGATGASVGTTIGDSVITIGAAVGASVVVVVGVGVSVEPPAAGHVSSRAVSRIVFDGLEGKGERTGYQKGRNR